MAKYFIGLLTCALMLVPSVSAYAACEDGADQISPVGKGFDKIHYTVPADFDGEVQIILFVDGSPREDGPPIQIVHHTDGYLPIYHPDLFNGRPGNVFKVYFKTAAWPVQSVIVTCDIDNNQNMIFGQPNGRSFLTLKFQWK